MNDGGARGGIDVLEMSEPRPLDKREAYAVPLRDAPRWERIIRIALAVLVGGLCLVYAYDELRAPRVIRTEFLSEDTLGRHLLADVTAGRTVRIDDRRPTRNSSGTIRWQNRDGAVYEYRDMTPRFDLRASVARQSPANPAALTFGRIHRRVHGTWDDQWIQFLGFLAALTIYHSAQPRHLTKWGWAWVALSGVGLIPYLLFSGSWDRHGNEPPPRRIGGVRVFFAITALSIVVSMIGDRVYDARHPLATRRSWTPAVLTKPFA